MVAMSPLNQRDAVRSACDRRANTLYLPPIASKFGCRHCYDLTYERRQQSRSKFVAHPTLGPGWLASLARRMGIQELPEVDTSEMLSAFSDLEW